MALDVEWSSEAINTLKAIVQYLEENWTEKELKRTSGTLEQQLSIISARPRIYKRSERLLGTHECLLSSHTSLLYKFSQKYVFLVTFWDNRQDPEKLKDAL